MAGEGKRNVTVQSPLARARQGDLNNYQHTFVSFRVFRGSFSFETPVVEKTTEGRIETTGVLAKTRARQDDLNNYKKTGYNA